MSVSRRRQGGGEFELLAKVRAVVGSFGRGRGVLEGIGDDCAVVESTPLSSRRRPGARRTATAAKATAAPALVLTTDTMVEGIHFRAGWLSPRELGVRAFRAAVSDIAAMGARPSYVLLSLEIPREGEGSDQRSVLALVRAIAAEANHAGAALVGGNISSGRGRSVGITVVGHTVGAALLRRRARPGDLVFVTGSLGGAAAGWRALQAQAGRATAASAKPTAGSTAAYRRPPLRLEFAAALAAEGLAHAMIDVSDGLLQDLGHVAQESAVTLRIDPDLVPIHRVARRLSPSTDQSAKAGRARGNDPQISALELALTGGEDYELAFTASARRRAAIERAAAETGTPLTVIGRVERGTALVTDTKGQPLAFAAPGFDHLRRPKPPSTRTKPPGTRKR